MVKKTVALLHGVTNNHGFIDGNKRTAHPLIDRSGYKIIPTRPRGDVPRGLEKLVKAFSRKSVTQVDAEAWFKARLRRRG
jgi:Fic/DOC family